MLDILPLTFDFLLIAFFRIHRERVSARIGGGVRLPRVGRGSGTNPHIIPLSGRKEERESGFFRVHPADDAQRLGQLEAQEAEAHV
jgi:hypothetical protein